MVKLVATQELRYAAKQYEIGDHFDASEKDARILKAINKAEYAPAVVMDTPPRAPLPVKTARVTAPVPPVPAPSPEPPPAPVVKAEDPVTEPPKAEEAPPAPKEEVTADAAPPKTEAATPTSTTNRYRRRDLQSQE